MNNTYAESYIDYVTKRAKVIQDKGISVGLADLGISELINQNPNTCYVLDGKGCGFIYTDGKVSYEYKEGVFTGTVTNANWAATSVDGYVVLHTQYDKMCADSAIHAWFRKKEAEDGIRIKRLGYPIIPEGYSLIY